MSGPDISMLIVGLTNNFRAFKHRNFVWILLAAPLLLLAAVAVFLVAMPQMGQAQDPAPAAPTELTAIPGDAQATLTWDDREDSSITGYEYLLQAQVAKLASSEWGPDDQFGYSVAVDGDTVVVGAHKDDDKGSNSGSAYVFTKTGDGWTTAKLIASDGAADDGFGISVAVDGDTVVVGAHKDDASNTVTNSGSVYLFTKPNTTDGWGDWDDLPQTHEEDDEDKDALTAKLTASDGAADDEFGISVAVDGDTVVVGAHKDDASNTVANSGSAYVFTKPDDGWNDDQYDGTETAKLTASDGAADDEFGISVAVDGDTVVVGTHKDDASNTVTNSGSVYLFTKPNTTDGWGDWDDLPQTHEEDDEDKDALTAKLTASDGAADDEFGISVAVDGDTVVVGAHKDDASDTVTNSGLAYLFTKPVTGWVTSTQTAKLTAFDGAGGDQLGISVAVDGDRVVVGANKDDASSTFRDSGSAYVFTKPATGWADATQTAKLTASDGARVDEFGYSVAVDGDTVVVGAPNDDFNGGNSGSAYVNEVSDWTAIPDSAHNSDPVGTNATSYTVTGLTNGVPYSFKLRAVNDVGPSAASDTVTSPPTQPTGLTATVKSTQVTLGWDAPSDPSDASITEYEYLQAQTTKLTASDGAAGDLFGHSVAVDGDTAVVGAYEDESGKGAAYVLVKDSSSGAWSQVAKLTASDGAAGVGGAAGDHFGWSVAVDGDTVVVGAHFDDDKGGGSGSAYVFTEPSGGWADWDPSSDTETAKLTASDGAMGDSFGESVAVDGITVVEDGETVVVDGAIVVVGAYFDDDKGTDSGSAYVFTKPSGGWADWSTSTDTEKAGLTAKLTASDGDEFDEFGKSVAVDEGTVVVGAPRNDGYGSAYVFTKPGTGWTATSTAAKLTPGDTGYAGDSLGGSFGASVAVRGNTVVVGASAYAGSQGRAYVFTKPSDGWVTTTEAAELATSDAEKNQFGWSVAVDEDTLVVGAHTDDASESVTGSGSAYLFTKAANSVWADATETVKLTAADGAGDDQFGWSIAAGGDTVVVGAHWDDDKGADSGSAYVYGVSGWTAIPDSAAGAINATSYTVNDLTNDQEYGFWIRARNTVGAGAASDAVTATPVNTAPTAVDDTATMYEDKVVSIGVVANDTDIDPIDTLSVTAVGAPSNGTAVKASNTTVTYIPNDNFNGADSFDYTLSDGTATDTGTVNITITAVNDAPTALDYTLTTDEDTAVGITVVNNDTDPDTGDTVTISSFTSPSNGTASPSSTRFTYIPDTNYNGTDSFVYTLSDGTATATGTVTISVTAVNDAPTAVKDTATTATDTAVDINVVANDTDVEGDTLSVTSVTSPSNGGAAIDMNDTTVVTYTPDTNYNGADSFVYTLSDGADTATSTVEIIVAAAQAQPAKPTGLTASAGLGQVTLDWTDPYDGSIDKYEYSKSVSASVSPPDSNLVWTDIPDSANGGTNGSSFTVTGLTNGTTYYFWIRATNTPANPATSDASDRVTATPGNAAPTFGEGDDASRSVEENSAGGVNVGYPVAATDPEGDMLTYSLSSDGTDADSFSIDAGNGQITVVSGANLNYEGAKSTYSVTVSVHDRKAIDGFSDTTTIDDTITVTIELSNVAEVPARPDGFTATRGDAQVTLAWNDPDPLDPSITRYEYLSEQQVAKLTAADGAADDYFGYSVAVDGDTAVMGAYGDGDRDDNQASDSGSAYVLVRQSGAWSQVAKLTASDGQGNDQFGRSVAVDGDTVVVGAVGGDGQVAGSGAAYVFTKPNTGWADAPETAKLTASDGANLDAFGFSVALDGDGGTVVVGAYWDDDNGGDSGSVYVFTKATDSDWADATETVKLTASDGAAGDSFGYSVELDGDTMAVAAYLDGDDDDDQPSNSGSAYVFTRQEGVWSQVAKLTASDAAADDYFGRSVAVDGDMVVVGADHVNHVYGNGNTVSNSGAAYVFTKPSGVWYDVTETGKLTASDGAADDNFGRSVAAGGDTVVVGAYQYDDTVSDSGAAYVFTKPGAGWTDATETTKLTASDGEAEDEFGISVAVAGDTVVVGAHRDDGSGSAYVYSVSDWTAIPDSAHDSDPVGTNATSYSVTNLTNGLEYSFQIRAVNSIGESDASDAATAVPMAPVLATPTPTKPMPTPTVSMPTPTPEHKDSNTTHNTAPMVVDDARMTSAGTAVDIDVVANATDLEGDTLWVISVTTPSNGTAVINSDTTTVTYIPNPGFHGTDSFNYTLSDGFNTVTGTVTVTVTPPNRGPEAVRSIAVMNLTTEGEAVSVDVSGGFTDQDGDLLTYSAVSLDTSVATVEVLGGTVTITPVAVGSTTIEITASDPHGARTTHSVPVTVRAAPDPPPQPTPTATVPPMPTPEPTSTPVPAPTPAMTLPPSPGPTVRPVPTATPRAEATATSTPAPTLTPGPAGTVAPTLEPVATPTTIPTATSMFTPRPDRTSTPVAISGRETAPTPTVQPVQPEADREGGGFLRWVILLVLIGAIVGLLLFAWTRRRRDRAARRS